MGAKLNLEKAHGTVHGDGVLAHYEQGGKYFDARGEEVETPLAEEAPVVVTKAEADNAYAKGKADAEKDMDVKIAAAVAAAMAGLKVAKPAP